MAVAANTHLQVHTRGVSPQQPSCACGTFKGVHMKICRDCGKNRKLSSYYTHSEMLDGHLNKCKDCVKTRVKRRYVREPKKIAAYERERFKTSNRKRKVLEYQKTRREKYPGKQKARVAVVYAIKMGRLTRLPCEVCGEPKSEAHHGDYRKKLDVRWLCFKHHRELHGQRVNAI